MGIGSITTMPLRFVRGGGTLVELLATVDPEDDFPRAGYESDVYGIELDS